MIKIICVGKIKENYLKDAINDYQKRLSKYTTIDIIEIMDESGNDAKVILKKEKDKILKHINNKDYIITLELNKDEISSIEFSKKIEKVFISYPNITFIIGSSFGLDEEVKKISNYKLSFSKMTFPHGLFRVILLEQIYRAFKIMNNEEYHK